LLIVADRNIPLLKETFGRHGDLRPRVGRTIGRADLDGADVLLVRSVTAVTRELLAGSAVRFVGSATIGVDHLDTSWMDDNGITWASAPGCNADAAAQYSLAMILLACERLDMNLSGLTAGIIGRGNVGSRVQKLLEALGVQTLANDPPLADAGVRELVGLEEALAQDIVCLHVPLTRDGPCPTWRMIGREALKRMRRGALLLNSARGNVVDGNSLLPELACGRLHAALDVWPGEPEVDPDLLGACTVATPHVAGYSEEGRRNGTVMIFREFCRWAGIPADLAGIPGAARRELRLKPGHDEVTGIIRTVSHVAQDDRKMRELMPLDSEARRSGFDALRRDYPLRSDFGAWRLRDAPADRHGILRTLGFRLAEGHAR
jgi:erythronate-4-phosphate dehydrogenase